MPKTKKGVRLKRGVKLRRGVKLKKTKSMKSIHKRINDAKKIRRLSNKFV